MKWEMIRIPRTEETVYKGEHPSGLPIYVLPKAGYTSTYAVFATRYGSVDTAFEVEGRHFSEVPAGVAHYLEHKLFENEDCDAFQKYAATGASANAFTSFGQTAYLFSCTANVERSLEILLDFVQNPYFTPENVEKERGIIGQEIRMCEDDPERAAMFGLLQMLYREHPVRIDIAGTEQSIADITDTVLYDCYRAFYNLHNMVLVVCGDITTETVEAVADRTLREAAPFVPKREQVQEPSGVTETYREQKMPVSSPLFYIGYKEPVKAGEVCSARRLMAAEVLLELLCSRGSALYTSLMEQELINETFGGGYFEGSGYAAYLFSGESKDPQAVRAALSAEIERFKQEGIDEQRFIEERNALYGRLIAGLNDVENCGDWLVDDHFYGRKPFELIDSVAKLDVQSVMEALFDGFDESAAALSVVLPV